jgi:hypothetical protein
LQRPELGSLQRAREEVKGKLKETGELLATLKGESAEQLQTLTQDIENGLKARYRKSERLAETSESLHISNAEMTVKLDESKKTLAALAPRISQREAK